METLSGAVPLPLDERLPAQHFPLDVLPPALQVFACEQSRALGCAVDFVAVPMLVVAGAALGNAWVLRLRDGGRAVGSLFAALVGRAGSGKSAAVRVVAAALVEEQMRALD